MLFIELYTRTYKFKIAKISCLDDHLYCIRAHNTARVSGMLLKELSSSYRQASSSLRLPENSDYKYIANDYICISVAVADACNGTKKADFMRALHCEKASSR